MMLFMCMLLNACSTKISDEYLLMKETTYDKNGEISQTMEYAYHEDGRISTLCLKIYQPSSVVEEGKKYGFKTETVVLNHSFEYNEDNYYALVYVSGNDIEGNPTEYLAEYFFDEKGKIIANDDGEWLTTTTYDDNGRIISSAMYENHYGHSLDDRISTGSIIMSTTYEHSKDVTKEYINGNYSGKTEVKKRDEAGNIIQDARFDKNGDVISASEYSYIKKSEIVSADIKTNNTDKEPNNTPVSENTSTYEEALYSGILQYDSTRNSCYVQLDKFTSFTNVIYSEDKPITTDKLWFFDKELNDFVGENVTIKACLQFYGGEVCFTDDYVLISPTNKVEDNKSDLVGQFNKAYEIIENILYNNPDITSVRFMVDDGWENTLAETYSDAGFNPINLSVNYEWPENYGYQFYITPYEDHILIMYDDDQYFMDTPYWEYSWNGELIYGLEGPFEDFIMTMRFMEAYKNTSSDNINSYEENDIADAEQNQLMFDEAEILPEFRFDTYTPEIEVSGYMRNGTQFVLDEKIALKGYWDEERWDILEELYIDPKYNLKQGVKYTVKGVLRYDEVQQLEIVEDSSIANDAVTEKTVETYTYYHYKWTGKTTIGTPYRVYSPDKNHHAESALAAGFTLDSAEPVYEEYVFDTYNGDSFYTTLTADSSGLEEQWFIKE